ncbi:MPN121 family protein [[Mycoplasma] testudinis]|uniref:MPN121 family protein n=1 Tax=[Mycoplasma] testudinis TaxID=33924 RepID=UPI00047F52B4|nr:hypothetical protein [[Mycoplasma] testudinis]
MSDSKKISITINLVPELVEELKANLKSLQGKQIPFDTSLEQLIELILSNYINSSKAMEKMNSGFLQELQEKFSNAMGGEAGSTDFYANLMKNFKNIFDPSQMGGNPFEDPADSKKEEPATKPTEHKKKLD